MLTFGSLFSGIGGLDLGLERAGFVCRWQSEIDPYACRVLAKHWPDITNIGDIRHVRWDTIEPVDVIVGGYPCQPFSTAGARNGTDDPRHLWPWFADAIRVLRPRYAVLENVSGHLALGFGHVLGDLATLGYDAEWDCIPASAVGAPHRRDRVFVLAYSALGNGRRPERARMAPTRWPAESREPHRRRGPVDHWATGEPGVGRVADGIPDQLDRLRGLGNAVVPQVAEHVARILLEQITQ